MKTKKEKFQDATAPFALLVICLMFTYIAVSESNKAAIFCTVSMDVLFLILTIRFFIAPLEPTLLEMFLKREGLLDEFRSEILFQNPSILWDEFVREYGDTQDAIDNRHFTYIRTERGEVFWREVNQNYLDYFFNINTIEYDTEGN